MHDHRRPEDAGLSNDTPDSASVKTGRPPRPQPLAPDFAGVPAELRAETAWVTWRYQFRDGRDGAAGKWTKIPLTPSTGRGASSTDASTWDTFAAACDAYDAGGVDGVGFVFAEDGPFFGVDLDACTGDDGSVPALDAAALDATARGVLDTLRTYAEWSPSGTGVHLIGRGELPPGARRRGTVEMYDRGRYFTVTGRPVDDRPAAVRDVSAALRLVHAALFAEPERPARATGTPSTTSSASPAGLGLSDAELVEKATSANDAGKFARLYYAGGKSEERAALLQKLAFWTNGDAGQMECLLRASAFNGPRLDEPRGAVTFAAYEVARALDRWDGVGYTGRPAPAPEPEGYTAEAFVDALGDAKGRAAEKAAAYLTADAARAAAADLPKMCAELQERGAREKWMRDWRADVRAQAKEDRAEASGVREAEDRGPGGLKGGALNEWLADRLREEAGGFAKDPGGALYRYDGARGHYVGPCAAWVAERVRETMKAVGSMEAWGKARTEAVEYDLATTAPTLWDTPKPGRLCLLNGLLNLDTGELEPHRPGAWLSTFGLPIHYDPAADDGGKWADYFRSVLPEDAPDGWGFELVRWLLSPASGKRPALMLHGPGDDGKSTFLGLLEHVLGGGSDSRAVSAATLQTLSSDRFGPADLYGAALNICADLPASQLDGVDVFKRITGGDAVRAEKKYGDAFNFRPFAHLLFSSNHPIKLRDASHDPAFWSRWIVVPFTNNFGEGSPDRRQLDALRADLLARPALSALLNAALACGFGGPPKPSPSMADALDAMRRGRRVSPVSTAEDGHGDGAGSDRAPRRPARRPAPLPTTFQTEEIGTPPPCVPNEEASEVVRPAETDVSGASLPVPAVTPQPQPSTPRAGGDGYQSGDGYRSDAEDPPDFVEVELRFTAPVPPPPTGLDDAEGFRRCRDAWEPDVRRRPTDPSNPPPDLGPFR